MSNYESTRDSAAQKTEEAKNVGQQKAGEAQQATKVSSSCHSLWKNTSCSVGFQGIEWSKLDWGRFLNQKQAAVNGRGQVI